MGRNNGSNGSRSSSARGFAAMNQEDQRAIARKGGEAVSRNREHMASIGRKGGEASAVSRSASGRQEGTSGNERRGSSGGGSSR